MKNKTFDATANRSRQTKMTAVSTALVPVVVAHARAENVDETVTNQFVDRNLTEDSSVKTVTSRKAKRNRQNNRQIDRANQEHQVSSLDVQGHQTASLNAPAVRSSPLRGARATTANAQSSSTNVIVCSSSGRCPPRESDTKRTILKREDVDANHSIFVRSAVSKSLVINESEFPDLLSSVAAGGRPMTGGAFFKYSDVLAGKHVSTSPDVCIFQPFLSCLNKFLF